jgi:hypothetical protein
MIDLEVVEDEELDDSEADICWMRTRARREILKVDLWVMRKRVSMCPLRLSNGTVS